MISVVIPAYNAQETLEQCLSALTKQTHPADSYEVIVVDDGSTDLTGKIAQDYAVRYIRQVNQGPAAARNNGVRQARGDIILFTDADCVPDNNWISEMLKPFDEAQVAAVKGAYRTRQHSLSARFAQLEFEERFELLKKADSIDMVDTYSAGFRRDIFLELGGFDTSFPVANNEDTELSYRMSAQGYKMVFSPQAIVCHLRHSDTIIKYARLKFWRGYWRMVVYKKFPDKMLKDSYTPQTLKLQILFLYAALLLLPLAAMWPAFEFPFFLSLTAFGIVCIPFGFFVGIRDLSVGLLSPVFLTIRAASLGAGMIWGVLYGSA